MNTSTMPNIYEQMKDLRKKLDEMEETIKSVLKQKQLNEIDDEVYANAAESLLNWGPKFKVVFSFSLPFGLFYYIYKKDYKLHADDIAEFSLSPGKSKEELEDYIRTTIEKLKSNTQ